MEPRPEDIPLFIQVFYGIVAFIAFLPFHILSFITMGEAFGIDFF